MIKTCGVGGVGSCLVLVGNLKYGKWSVLKFVLRRGYVTSSVKYIYLFITVKFAR